MELNKISPFTVGNGLILLIAIFIALLFTAY